MGFNIKNNYGPNIEVNAGGKVTLTQDRSGLWHTVDAEEAEYEEVTTPQVPQKEVAVASKDYGHPQTDVDFKAVFDKEMKEKEALKETAQQEYKIWKDTECFGSPTLEKLENYRLSVRRRD